MTISSLCIVFEVSRVESGRVAPPSSYLFAEAAADISKLTQKVLELYKSRGCSVQVFMGRSVEELTTQAVIPVDELLGPVNK